MIYIEGVPEKKVPCDIFRQRYDKPGNGQYYIRFRYLPRRDKPTVFGKERIKQKRKMRSSDRIPLLIWNKNVGSGSLNKKRPAGYAAGRLNYLFGW